MVHVQDPSIIARAPLRVSFAGGGTDLPAYYDQHGGLVLSTTIVSSVYAGLTPHEGRETRIALPSGEIAPLRHTLNETVNGFDPHSLPGAVMRVMEADDALTIALSSDVPLGTGLGSSSAMAVALILAVAAAQGRLLTPGETAELASRVEIEELHQPIGKQDQYASAYGGVNIFHFQATDVRVTPIHLSLDVRATLEEHLTLYYTGNTRRANQILTEQRRRTAHNDAQTIESLHAIKGMVAPMQRALETGDMSALGRLLDEGWSMKRHVSSGITTNAIDDAYTCARAAGASGGKITGAGGGGFLLLVVPPEAKHRVREGLTALGLKEMPLLLESQGAHILIGEEHDQANALIVGRAARTLP